ncbi:MAG TPA: hypothetical protein VFE53_21155 [Mucilaginibacter sp.]|nr:hypothetical protein [Mucilaginibacter sp.]
MIPETIISSSIEELEHEFVIKLNDEKRKELFEQYKLYCKNLKALYGNKILIQWIDGSYVTLRKNPSDIYLVFFIDYEIAKSNKKELKEFVYPQSKDKYGIDGYMVVVYPDDSKYKNFTIGDCAYWVNHFGKTKQNRQMKRIPKGFLEIIV